jgi:hypothetical protein
LIYFHFEESSAVSFFFTPWFLILAQVISFLIPLGLWLAFTRDKLVYNLPHMKLGKINIITITALCFFAQPALMLISALSTFISPNNIAGTMMEMQQYPYVVIVAAMALTPAFCEEVVFRGYALSQFNKLDIKKAAWLTGLGFGLIHMDAQQLIYATLMGVALAYLVYYTRSIRAGVLAHFLINFFQVSLQRLISMMPAETVEAAEYAEADIWPAIAGLAVLTLIFTAAAVPLFKTFLLHNRQRNIRYDMKEVISSADAE